ncbi:tetratricopeptide repeat protein, partial [Pedobacter sp. HMF7647]
MTWQYARAAPIYQKLSKRKNTSPVVYYRLGYSYEQTGQYQQSIEAYRKYLDKNPKADSLWERIGDLSKVTGQYEDAKAAYGKAPSQSPLIKDKTAGCDSAQSWLKNPSAVTVKNMGAINTTASDWGAVYYGQNIVFVSDSIRKQVFNQKRQETYGWTGRPYLKIYQTANSFSGSTGTDTASLKDFSAAINDSKYHTGPVTFSKNQDTVYYTVTDMDKNKTLSYQRMGYRKGLPVGTRKLELYYRIKQADGSWGNPKQLNWENTKNYSVGLAALSRDGQTLYFVSDMPGGQGKADI